MERQAAIKLWSQSISIINIIMIFTIPCQEGMEILSIFTILYQKCLSLKSWNHAPHMGLAWMNHAKPMPWADFRWSKTLIWPPYKGMQLCYMMLIIGENTLVYCFLKAIIVLNSTAASKKSLSGRKILREYRGVKVSA